MYDVSSAIRAGRAAFLSLDSGGVIASEPHPPTPVTMTRTLLVVDDNKSVRDSLRFLLMRKGYAVFVAEHGAEGIALAGQSHIDGALVDVNMPGMNGIDTCRALKEQATAQGRGIAVWMMTGARTPELLRQATEAGALALLGKPFDFSDLFNRFDEAIGKQEPPRLPPDALDEL
jgi:CheY-like chemotaxis protein